MIVYEDVIYIIPNEVVNEFRVYLQKEITKKWEESNINLSKFSFKWILSWLKKLKKII